MGFISKQEEPNGEGWLLWTFLSSLALSMFLALHFLGYLKEVYVSPCCVMDTTPTCKVKEPDPPSSPRLRLGQVSKTQTLKSVSPRCQNRRSHFFRAKVTAGSRPVCSAGRGAHFLPSRANFAPLCFPSLLLESPPESERHLISYQ